MIKLLPLLLLAMACNRATPPTTDSTTCLDPAKIRKDAMCTMQYDPVCGCNNITYGNACTATNAGVLRFTPGACPDSATPTTPR